MTRQVIIIGSYPGKHDYGYDLQHGACCSALHFATPWILQANVKAKFQYQRTSFPQISGDGSAYVESVGGHAKLGIRVANDGAGRPLVCLSNFKMVLRLYSGRNSRDLGDAQSLWALGLGLHHTWPFIPHCAVANMMT